MKKVVFSGKYGYYCVDDVDFEETIVAVRNPKHIKFTDIREDKNGNPYAVVSVKPAVTEKGYKYYEIVEDEAEEETKGE